MNVFAFNKQVWLGVMILAALYTFWWDVNVDWGLWNVLTTGALRPHRCFKGWVCFQMMVWYFEEGGVVLSRG